MKTLLKTLFLICLIPVGLQGQKENVDVDGAVRIGAHTKASPDAGTVEFDGTNFRGYDGSVWWPLDLKGIVSAPGQSAASAWLSWNQPIPNDQWTPVLFDMIDFDNQAEFTRAPIIPSPPAVINEQAYFKATADGVYQINARCEFNLDSLNQIQEPDLLGPSAYVSIAIVVSDSMPPMDDPYGFPSMGLMVAQGNNHQIAIDALGSPVLVSTPDGGEVLVPTEPDGIGEPLLRNNAPNVSDAVYLRAGDVVSIWVLWYTNSGISPATYYLPLQPFHKIGSPPDEAPVPELAGPPPFAPDLSKVYFSIVKLL